MQDIKDIKLVVNNKAIPLNNFVRKLLAKIIFSFVTSLKGLENEEIRDIQINVRFE